MKAKWRYNIRLAQKKGVQVTEEGEKGLDEFMQLYRETSKRDKIAIHSPSYYRTLFQTVSQIRTRVSANSPIENLPELSLYIARHEGNAIAGIIVLRYGRMSTYLYGASSDQKRNLMPAYALQWYAIQDAKRKGASSYDLFGIPPEGTDDSHPMAGLYLFKTGFGGEIVHRYGAHDVALHSVLYRIFRASEAMRLMWHKKLRKKLRKIFHRIGM
jgi:lipid II:glycine glycyltransferase (peptidoglycan interpeptide bridge formation enzyme)